MGNSETFYNPLSNETLRHRNRSDGKTGLFIWKGNTTKGDHEHHVFDRERNVNYSRGFGGNVIADDKL